MKKKTIAKNILDYLNDKGWVSSTILDKEVASIAHCKEATVSREARKLAEDEKIHSERRSKVVWYKIGEEVRHKRQVVEIINGVARVTYN